MTVAFLCPGQGTQRPQAGRQWADGPGWSLVGELSDAAAADLEGMLLRYDAEMLRPTFAAQLAVFTSSLLALHALRETLGVRPSYVAGHSIGEYAALVAAEVLTAPAAARIVATRGRAMQAACDAQPGTMRVIVGLGEHLVDSACRRADDDVWIANYNAPDQVVISGAHAAVEEASHISQELGAKGTVGIEVAGAFHTRYMLPARPALRAALAREDLRDACVPVIANVDAESHVRGIEWPSLLSAQLCNPVRWSQTIERLWRQGVRTFVEIGSGRTLTSLLRRSWPDARAVSICEPGDLESLASLLRAADDASEATHQGFPLDRPRADEGGAERVAYSPAAGEVSLEGGTPTTEGLLVTAGETLAHVDGVPVAAPCSGWLTDCSTPGARVVEGDVLLRVFPHRVT